MNTRDSELDLVVKAHDAMDQMITDMLDWSDVVFQLGLGPNKIEPGAMRLIGGAMNALAEDLRCRWDVVDRRMEMIRGCSIA